MKSKSSLVMAGLLSVLLWSAPRAPGQSTWHVATNGADVGHSGMDWTEPFLTISNAIAQSAAGDVVIVSNGTYLVTEPIEFGDLTVQSLNGPFLTAIDGGQAVRCVTMTHSNARLKDFTVQNGLADNGGGVYIPNGGLISNCRITGNVSVSTNNKYYDGGGGISASGVSLVEDCWIYGNSASNGGGGIRCRGGELEVRNTTIASNYSASATYAGAGISSYGGYTLRMFDCLVTENYTEGVGGGVGWIYGLVEIDRCRFIGNHGKYGGGGIYTYCPDTALIRNTVVANNSTWGGTTGPGIFVRGMDNTMTYVENCTVVSNSGGTGGLTLSKFTTTGGTADVVNCIIYFNKGGVGTSNVYLNVVTSTFYNCCTAPIDTLSGADNMDVNPELIDWAGGNYRLLPGSPCLNAGLNAEWMEGARDLEGYTRIDRFFRRVDIGAYEDTRQGALFSVR